MHQPLIMDVYSLVTMVMVWKETEGVCLTFVAMVMVKAETGEGGERSTNGASTMVFITNHVCVRE